MASVGTTFHELDHLIEGDLNLNMIMEAAEEALRGNPTNIEAVALRAANAMPAGTSDLDRGIATGFAVARYLDRAERNLDCSCS